MMHKFSYFQIKKGLSFLAVEEKLQDKMNQQISSDQTHGRATFMKGNRFNIYGNILTPVITAGSICTISKT